MFMSAMVWIMFMSWKMECSIQRGGAELNGTFWNIPAFNEWTYSHHFTNKKHSLFVLYNIQVDLCHFDWKIQLSKQSVGLKFLIVEAECYKFYKFLCLAVTPAALPKARARSDVFTQLFRMERKNTVSDSACNGTFICYHVTDNPPIKWQGSAWVLYKI